MGSINSVDSATALMKFKIGDGRKGLVNGHGEIIVDVFHESSVSNDER